MIGRTFQPARRALTTAAALVLVPVLVLASGPPPAGQRAPGPPALGSSAQRTAGVEGRPHDPVVPGFGEAPSRPTPKRCDDTAGTWLGARWYTPLRWRVNRDTLPTYLGPPNDVLAAIRRGAWNVDAGNNACGLFAELGTAQHFDGDTGARAGLSPDGRCDRPDGTSTVSFGPLDAGMLAITCLWWLPPKAGRDGAGRDGAGRDGAGREGRSVEADILVSDSPAAFFLTGPAGCADRWDLESALTHEFGHAFGLGHVPADTHGGQTMSDSLDACATDHRRLGLGDYLMLRGHYGAG